jgi:acetoin utilization protein AcuC
VSDRVALIVAPEARLYDLGPQHPLRPDRVLLTWDLIEACGLDALPNVTRSDAEPADEPLLGLVHTPAYNDATRRAGHGEVGDWSRFGYGPGDNPVFDRMHEAGAIVAGASVEAARAVRTGAHEHAFNAAGGLHHAMPARGSGFCVYDDPAVAIAWLLREGVERIAYVDVDVHHGDGPQAIFWDDPRVLTISIHQYQPGWFFPGTGGPSERGGPRAPDSALNVPMPPFAGDDGWWSAFEAVVPAAVRAFAPQILVTQLGADAHHEDPLANLRLTTAVYRRAAAALHALAHEVCDGRWVATGGGGYGWARAVPRIWTLWFAEMVGAAASLDDALPEAWVREAAARVRAAGLRDGAFPTTFSEQRLERSPADDEAVEVGRAIAAILARG